MFLSNLCTNDTKNLPLGGGCEAYFCDSRAKVQFAAWIYHIKLGDGRHAMWVETTPGRNTELVKYLDRYLISERVEIADVTDPFALHLAGPKAGTYWRRRSARPCPNSRVPNMADVGANATCSIRRDHWGSRGLTSSSKDRAKGVRGSHGGGTGNPETF